MHVKRSIVCETQKLNKAKSILGYLEGQRVFGEITGNELGEVGEQYQIIATFMLCSANLECGRRTATAFNEGKDRQNDHCGSMAEKRSQKIKI